MKTANIEVTLIDHCGSDLSVVNAARVSFHKESEWEANENSWGHLCQKDERLVYYLAKHKHTSPFNHAFMSFRVKAPIYVARQLVKHEYMPWNEVSRRYVDEEPEFYFSEYRERAADKKQGSNGPHPQAWELGLHTKKVTQLLLEHYNYLLENGVAPEQAREVLPLNTMTEWIWSGTLGAFAKMFSLRLAPDTQEESRRVAKLIYAQAEPLFPVSLKALLETE